MEDRKKRHNVVWIEIERFDSNDKNEAAAAAVSKMIAKLGATGCYKWTKDGYVFQTPDGSYWELPEGGHSFNLDFLAK